MAEGPTLRGILKTAATQWAKKEAQRTALVGGLNRELVLKVLVLGGDGAGKSSLIDALAGVSRGPRHEPTRGVECSTVHVATLRSVPVYVQLCEAPLDSLRAPAHTRAGDDGRDASIAGSVSKLQSDLAFSGVHAVVLLVDAGSDAAAAGRSLAAADWLRDALETKLLGRLQRRAGTTSSSSSFPVLLVAHKARAALLLQEQRRRLAGGGEPRAREAGGPVSHRTSSGSRVAGGGCGASMLAPSPLRGDNEDDASTSSSLGGEGGPLRPVSAMVVAAPRQTAASSAPATPGSGVVAGDAGPRRSHLVRYGSSTGSSALTSAGPSPDHSEEHRHSEDEDVESVVGGLSATELRSYAAAAGFTGGLWLTAVQPCASELAGDHLDPRGAPAPVGEHSAAAVALRQASVQQLLAAIVELSLAHWGFRDEEQAVTGEGGGEGGEEGDAGAAAGGWLAAAAVDEDEGDGGAPCCELALLAGSDGTAQPGGEPIAWSDCRLRALALAGFPHARVPRVSARLLRELGLG